MPTSPPPHCRTLDQGRALLAEWRASGMNGHAFCKSRQISRNRIAYWKGRLASIDQDEAGTPSSPAFIQVDDPAPRQSRPAPGALTATLPNGLAVTIHPGSDLTWTTRVIEALLRLGMPC
jgi:hypothetical protein